jgi:type II secretory pathway pseudopilin PulG
VRICARVRGFSRIELLIVIGIVVVSLAVWVPATNGGREAARSLACRNNLRQIGLAFHTYQNLNERFPIGYVSRKHDDPLSTDPGWGWSAMILPSMEQGNLAREIDYNRSIASPTNVTSVRRTLEVFICPSDRGVLKFTTVTGDGKALGPLGPTSYAGNYGSRGDVAAEPGRGNGFFVRNRCFALDDFEDGLSNTFAVGERAALHTKTFWAGATDGVICRITPGAPSRSKKIGRGAVQVLAHIGDKPLNSLDSDPDEFFSGHIGGSHFVMGDGAVRFIRSTINQASLRAHASRNGDEMISGTKY